MIAKRMSKAFRFWFLISAVAVIVLALAIPRFQEEAERSGRSIDELLANATKAIEHNEPETAARDLSEILTRDSLHSRALILSAQLASDAGRTNEAIRFLERIPDTPNGEGCVARFMHAVLLLQQGKAMQAEQFLLRSTILKPDYDPPNERLIALYKTQLRRDDLRRELWRIRQSRPWSIPELVLATLSEVPVENSDASLAVLDSFATQDGSDSASRVALAQYHVQTGQDDQAIKVLEPLAMNEQNELAAALLSEIRLKSGRPDRAYDLLRTIKCTATTPDSAWASVGNYCMQIADWEQAARCFSYLSRHPARTRLVEHQLATALLRLGRTIEAESHFESARTIDRADKEAIRATKGDPRRTDLLFPVALRVAELLQTLQRFPESLEWFRLATSLQPNHERATAGLLTAAQAVAQLNTPGPSDVIGPSPDDPSNTVPIVAIRPPDRSIAQPNGTARVASVDIELNDTHESAGLTFQYNNGESGKKYIIESTGGGVAVLDFDNDRWPDLYFPQGGPCGPNVTDNSLSDSLFRNRADGTFDNCSHLSVPPDSAYGQGVSSGDFDNDGFEDIFVGNVGRNILYHNNGDGTFTNIAQQAGITEEHATSSAAFADLDRDGDLDLYVVNYVEQPFKVCRGPDGTYRSCSPSNFHGEQDILYLNEGDGLFRNITHSSGVTGTGGRGLGVVVADLDRDGLPDIYVANDATPNFLYHNAGETPLRFEEQAFAIGVAVGADGRAEGGMGIACGDLNGDQTLDLYVTNFINEANTQYLNTGGIFTAETADRHMANQTRNMVGFGTQAVDFNLDGNLDLFVANGHVDDFRAQGEPWKMSAQLFSNAGSGHFDDVSKHAGEYFQHPHLGRGVARLDYNRDMRPDLIVVHQDANAALLRNDSPAFGQAISIGLRGVRSNRDGIGTVVQAVVGKRTLVVEICGGDGYFASNERACLIGIGSANQVDELQIQWPSGLRQVLNQIPAGSQWILVEGQQPVPAS